MRLSSWVGLLVFVYASLPFAHADNFDGDQVESVFDVAFFDPSIYRIADCSSNVWRLLRRLDERGIDLSTASVLYIFQTSTPDVDRVEANLTKLHPLHAKMGIGPYSVPWVFHVSLVIEQTVFDLDYRHFPRPELRARYFEEMFSPEERKHLFIRAIPATEYLKEYQPGGEERSWRYFLNDQDHRFLYNPAELCLN